MQSLPVFISSASCRAQVIIKRKKQISKTTLLFIHIQTKKADKFQGGGVDSFPFAIILEGSKFRGFALNQEI